MKTNNRKIKLVIFSLVSGLLVGGLGAQAAGPGGPGTGSQSDCTSDSYSCNSGGVKAVGWGCSTNVVGILANIPDCCAYVTMLCVGTGVTYTIRSDHGDWTACQAANSKPPYDYSCGAVIPPQPIIIPPTGPS